VSGAVRFSETMAGRFTFGVEDFTYGELSRYSHPLAFRLTIRFPDVKNLPFDPLRRGEMSGVVVCEALGGRLDVLDASFNLLLSTGHNRRQMRYRLEFCNSVGAPLSLLGVKEVGGATSPLELWRQTTTLFTVVLSGHGHSFESWPHYPRRAVGAGITKISISGFLRQLTTFRAFSDGRHAVAPLWSFASMFLQDLYSVSDRSRFADMVPSTTMTETRRTQDKE
jgi:hypothetical protein